MKAEELQADRAYAYALSQTLCRISPPATVGLYSSCQSRLCQVLNSIEYNLKTEAAKREGIRHPKSREGAGVSFFALLIRMLFYRPVFTEELERQQNIRYIFVRFSAWHFAGSDVLWAGLVLRLYVAFHESFGKFLLSLYRVVQHTVPKKQRNIVDSKKEWSSRKIGCIPLWLLSLLTFLGAALIISLLIKFGLCNEEEKGEEGSRKGNEGRVTMIEGFAIAVLGVPAVGVMRFTLLVAKNLIFSQDYNMRKMMDNEKVSSQLGFMNEVRKEMDLLSCFIRFMEVFERRKIRVVLEITHLERCKPRRIVGVLDAINILLSDDDSPFISLLAVNPEVLTQQVDYGYGFVSKEDRAHAFLNRVVTLPFTVPELHDASKRNIIKSIYQGQSEISEDIPFEEQVFPAIVQASLTSEESSVETGSIPLLSKDSPQKEEEIESVIMSSFTYIYSHLYKYITGDTMSMRRIINSVKVSIIVMWTLKIELTSTEHLAAWVVLANQWPCRLSWILQCMEDDKQRAEIDQTDSKEATFDTSKTLWTIFSESRVELHMIRGKAKSLLEQDGDPELFELFLKVDFKFTARDAERFKLCTVNLDHSIQRELARFRGRSRLKDIVNRKTPMPLSVKCVINMSTEDVCKEMAKLRLPERYAALLRDNHLDGQTLVYSDTSEIRAALNMTLGEWTLFAIHFLGKAPPTPPLMAAGDDRTLPALAKLSRRTSVANPFYAEYLNKSAGHMS